MPRKVITIDDIAEPYRSRLLAERSPEARLVGAVKGKLPNQPFTITQEKHAPKLNETERNFLLILRGRYRDAEIRIMPMRFQLGWKCSYLPDVMVTLNPMEILFYEVKGAHIWPKNLIKFKTAARMFPEFKWILAQWKNNQWTETKYT